VKRLNAFAELAMIYTYAYPIVKCPNPDFISSQLKAYTALLKKNENYCLSVALSTQAVFAFMCKGWDTVKRVLKHETAGAVFYSMNLGVYIEILDLTLDSPLDSIALVKKKVHAMLNTAVNSDMLY
jgi:hypothetical protein